jgi:hypothetical protein
MSRWFTPVFAAFVTGLVASACSQPHPPAADQPLGFTGTSDENPAGCIDAFDARTDYFPDKIEVRHAGLFTIDYMASGYVSALLHFSTETQGKVFASRHGAARRRRHGVLRTDLVSRRCGAPLVPRPLAVIGPSCADAGGDADGGATRAGRRLRHQPAVGAPFPALERGARVAGRTGRGVGRAQASWPVGIDVDAHRSAHDLTEERVGPMREMSSVTSTGQAAFLPAYVRGTGSTVAEGSAERPQLVGLFDSKAQCWHTLQHEG